MFIAVFVYSCQNDDDTLTPETANTPAKITSHYKTTLTATEIKNNALLQSKFAQLQQRAAKAGANKTALGFDIYKNKAQVVIHKYFTSYTFLVKCKPRNKNVVENYIINQYYNGSTTQFLVSYPLLGRKQLDTENATVTPLNGDPLVQLKTTAKTSSAFTVEYDYCAIREAIPCKGLDPNGKPVLHLPDSPICTLKGDPDRKPYWVCHGAWVIRINEPIGYNNDAPQADPCSADYKDYLEELIEEFGDRHDTSDISWFLDYLEDECERNTALNNGSTGSSTGGNSGSSGSGSSSGGAPPEPVVLESMIGDVQDVLEDLTDADITFTKSDIETMETWYELESVAFDIVEEISDLTQVYVDLGGDAQMGQDAFDALMDHDFNEARRIVDFMQRAIDIKTELPTARFDRILELDNILRANPWALIQDCAQQNGLDISNYKQLYNHSLPSQCRNRLNVLGNDFKDQPLNKGNAAVANVDYYGVEITIRPDINNDGVPDTNAEIYQAYKNNFSSLASGGKDDFEFSCNNPFGDNYGDVSWTFSPYFANDNSIWNSTNPLTAIFKIDASAEEIPFGNFISDDGAIMISKFTPQYWIGSTITTEFSGTQPFSGNRQWGYITNLNGNLELYARALDVARVSDLVKYFTPGSNDCKEDSYYNIGEATWSNLQDEIKQFIIDKGGQAIVIQKKAVRFDKNKLKQILESYKTIDQIPCN